MTTITDCLNWLENSSWAIYIRQSLYLYPALEIVHILGIVLLVGAAFMFDLRLLGYSNQIAVKDLSNYLLPWSHKGLYLIIPSGVLLFITNAKTLAFDPVFWFKMILLFLAACNVLVFHKYIIKVKPNLKNGSSLPFFYQISALISIVLWIAIIACGRLLAY